MTNAKERKTRTVEETARILGMGLSSAYEAIRRGEIPSVKIGRRYLVPVATLDRLTADKGE